MTLYMTYTFCHEQKLSVKESIMMWVLGIFYAPV